MIPLTPLLATPLLLSLGITAQVECEPACPLSAAEARADLEHLLAQVERHHPRPFRILSRTEWEESIQRIAAAPELREPATFQAVVLGLLARMGDGHMDAYPPESWESVREVYPVKMVAFPDGLHVTAAAPGYDDLVGVRILSIGGEPVDEALRRLRSIVPSDNGPGTRELLEDYLRMPAHWQALGLIDDVSEATLTIASGPSRAQVRLRDPGAAYALPVGPPRRSTPPGWIDARGDGPHAPWQRHLDSAYWMGELPELDAVFLQMNRIAAEPDETLTPLAEKLRKALSSDEVDRLIVDLRFNRGGDATLYAPLLRAIAGEQKLHRPGGLYVLISSYTFSAAVHFAAELERLTHATFVGEPTAAPPNHYADATSFELPHSGIEVETSTLYWQKSDPRDRRRWLHPDIPAPITFVDWKADVDPVLEAIAHDLRRLSESLPDRPTPRNWTRYSQRPALP